MTVEQTNKELTSDNEQPIKVESAEEAFQQFAPKVDFKTKVGDTEFQADLSFSSLKSFEPENILKHQGVKNADGYTEYRRNDLADLKIGIDMLYRLRKAFDENALRRAWGNPEQRKEIIRLIGDLQSEVKRIAEKGEE